MTKTSDDTLDWIKGSTEDALSDTAVAVSGDLIFEGTLGIAESESMHQRLAEILDAHVDVFIQSEDLSRVDAAGVQLIYAFVKEAEIRSVTVIWKSVSDALLETATALGLSESMGFELADA